MARDYYEVLGVARDASETDIRNAYRRLARQHHPDVNRGDKSAEARFKEVNEAYQVLSHAEARKRYDTHGRVGARGVSPPGGGTPDPFSWLSGSPGRGGRRQVRVDFGGAGLSDSLFDELFGGGRRGRTVVEEAFHAQPVEAAVTVSLEEAYRGATRLVSLPADPFSGAPGRRLEVTIPPGVRTGSRVHVGPRRRGRGEGPDLSVAVTVAPHDRFERKGDDLSTTVTVPLADAMLGAEVEVPTVKGTKVALKLPPETQNGRTFRLRGQGMPKLGSPSQHGDLYATVQVELPSALTGEERAMFERLRERGRR